ncbi:crotonobetainyl-CoA:carnitine CoA-transferase CaiB-like acyl-CoA transferase [Rhodoferax ferrireducens]|uniref:Crotonobetainyl-CoA:carnitine CoA-transferase CaiB-like acyl-CoA transferase n=1 Tax=Rhodoferax ferrireducens TaxID=192843 RepID=A0ABU2C5U0_9BURK|nr:CoA transferase [Rhodoferax ferrireducens]MDR7376709.1 crotonobetainyl-CoA:carnitine CoA-transferase CaiB-like acyl-CoA transferase [Rhodoferax ferrireducens]
MPKNTQAQPLAGIRVVDYSHFLAGPYLGRCLAAMGAEVIKVERPKAGDAGRAHAYFIQGQSGYFLQQNMGKQGLCINLKDPRGLALMHKLTDSADVFVENYRPGALTKLGLGYDELSARNPGLVYCSISAYGHTGPDAHRAGFGLIAEAKSGIMAMVGSPGEAPPLLRVSLGDMYTGIHGVAAVCAALLGRVKSGKGQHIDLSLYDCLVSMHDYAVQCYTLSGGKDIPVQTGHDMPQSTLYGVFSASDGYLVIAAQVDDAWKRFALLIGGEALAGDTRFHTSAGRNEHRLEILALAKTWVGARTVAEVLAALDAIDVPSAKVQNIEEVLNDPQIQARNMVIEQQHPVLGAIRMPNLPFNFSGCDSPVPSVAPTMGQHNRQIAGSLGYSDTEIDALLEAGVLYTSEAI